VNLAGERARIELIEPLRGLAALAVAWYHLTVRGNILPEGSWIRATGEFGWLGVEVFFVISGFIIPYSLWRGHFRIRKDLGIFLAKRIIRLDPPYLVAIVLLILLGSASAFIPGYAKSSPTITVPQVLCHLGYLNAFLGYEWLSPVFWTLAIEFQYYVLVALAFPLFASRIGTHRLVALALLTLSGVLLDQGQFVFRYGGLFSLGIVTFQKHLGLWSVRQYLGLLVTISFFTILTLGLLNGVVGTATALLIAFYNIRRNRTLALLGAMSYSLYLMHWPIGMLVIHSTAQFATSDESRVAILGAALAASFLSSYLLFRLIERPVQRWSSSIRYTGEMANTSRKLNPDEVLPVTLPSSSVVIPKLSDRTDTATTARP